jgi:hypothetical protein
MERKQKLSLINEIKQIERELYLKRSQLASSEELSGTGIHKGLNTAEWVQMFSHYIEEIGRLSAGGNSVEDVAVERQR